jgi:hypothetical protein
MMLYSLHLCFMLQITQADFELTKHAQENSKLRSKLVKSPEKVQVRHLPFFCCCRHCTKFLKLVFILWPDVVMTIWEFNYSVFVICLVVVDCIPAYRKQVGRPATLIFPWKFARGGALILFFGSISSLPRCMVWLTCDLLNKTWTQRFYHHKRSVYVCIPNFGFLSY